MVNFTPYTQLLMELLSELAEPDERIVLQREMRLLPFLPDALKLINDAEDAPPHPEHVRNKLKRERHFLERVSFIGSTEFILFDTVYGTNMKALHSFLSSPKISGLNLNLKTILDEHIYSRGEFRTELMAELSRTSEYLYSDRAKNELKVRILTDGYNNRADWSKLYSERLAGWQSSVDELWCYWEMDS
jgi:hypothetical protein